MPSPDARPSDTWKLFATAEQLREHEAFEARQQAIINELCHPKLAAALLDRMDQVQTHCLQGKPGLP